MYLKCESQRSRTLRKSPCLDPCFMLEILSEAMKLLYLMREGVGLIFSKEHLG